MDIIPHPTGTRRIFLTGVGSLVGRFRSCADPRFATGYRDTLRNGGGDP